MPSNLTSGLRLEEVSKSYPSGESEVQVLRNISLAFTPGEFVALQGPSGSGKSTLMNILGCLDRPSSGHYFINDQKVSTLGRAELAKVRNRSMGFVFQSFQLLPQSTALENVELPLLYSGISAKERRQRAAQMLERLGLSDRSHHRPAQLSGGQQQRVAIARALVTAPAFIFADEPTGNLDTATSHSIMHLLTEVHQQGVTIILVTHEADIATYANRRITLRDGQITAEEAA